MIPPLRLTPLILAWLGTTFLASSAQAAPLCTNLILETSEGAPLLQKYEQELKKALVPQLNQFGWKRDAEIVSVQNMPSARSRVAPHYLIRFDLTPTGPRAPKVVLRNKTTQTALKIDSYPHPEKKLCELVLQARGDEYLVAQKNPDNYLVNVDEVPTRIYVPKIVVRYLVPLREADEKSPKPRSPRAIVVSGTTDSVITHRQAPPAPRPARPAHPLTVGHPFRGDRIK